MRMEMEPKVYFRKLWHPVMVARWKAGQLTSYHLHGEPPEWIPLRQQGNTNAAQYPLLTHYGRGMALPSAVEKYIQICVQAPASPWATVPEVDQNDMVEQAGVFAFTDPVDAYWYCGAATANDIFVVFTGVEVCPGPEARSALVTEVKKIASLDLQEFQAQYTNGVAPPQPAPAASDLRIDHTPQSNGPVGDDEDVHQGEMPVLRRDTAE